jgi:hypothetical protein
VNDIGTLNAQPCFATYQSAIFGNSGQSGNQPANRYQGAFGPSDDTACGLDMMARVPAPMAELPADTALPAPLTAIEPAVVAIPAVVVTTLTVAVVRAAPVATTPQPAHDNPAIKAAGSKIVLGALQVIASACSIILTASLPFPPLMR